MEKFVVLKTRKAEEGELHNVIEGMHAECLDTAGVYVPSLVNHVVPCSDKDSTDWGATIDGKLITLPTGEKIFFDDDGRIIRTEIDGNITEKEGFWDNGDTIVNGTNCKIIYNSEIHEDGSHDNVAIILWEPIYLGFPRHTNYGLLHYSHQLFVYGTNVERLQVWNNEDADYVKMNLQFLYDQIMGIFLHNRKKDIEVIVPIPEKPDEVTYITFDKAVESIEEYYKSQPPIEQQNKGKEEDK